MKPESDEQEEESDEEKKQVTDEEEAGEEETKEEETEEEKEKKEKEEQQDNDEAEERQEAKGDQPEDTDEEEDQQQEQEEQQTNQQQQVNEQELTNQQEELQEKSDIFHAQGHDQPQTPTKEDDNDKLISTMRAQMQDMEQKFMAELRKKENQLKEMSVKKPSSPRQRSMVKRIKQKSRKQAHDLDFEYQPMTKAKENTRNKTQTAADVPKPTEGTDEEKEKKNEKKKEEIETETEPATEPMQKEGAHEAKQQQKEKMQEDIGQEKTVAAETNPKEHANQEKTQLQVLESDDDFKEESIQNKPLVISCRKTNKVWHSLSKKDQDQIQFINNTQSSACVWPGSEDENRVDFSDICKLTNSEPLYGNVIDAFSEKQLALQPTIEEFEKNDLAFARNPYAGRSYVFSTLINTPLQNQDQALREKMMDNHFSEAMKNRYIHFPINHDKHWTIVVFDNADGIWRHYDSLRLAKDCQNKHFEIAKEIQHQLRWNKALLSNQGNMLSSQECETVIASIEECPQQTPHSNDCAIAVCNIINQYINWQPLQKSLRPTEWVKFRAEIVIQFLNDEIPSWQLEHYQMLTKHTKP
ncbi:unnamed protein product [Camellia sinensis]